MTFEHVRFGVDVVEVSVEEVLQLRLVAALGAVEVLGLGVGCFHVVSDIVVFAVVRDHRTSIPNQFRG